MTDPDARDEARALKREHKHTQESIEGGEAVAPREYAAYQERTEWGDDWDNYAEDTLLIDIVDPASGKLLWAGSGEGNTRYGADEEARMRGVKEAVRHIMRDLK
jgi:hypothetical protein